MRIPLLQYDEKLCKWVPDSSINVLRSQSGVLSLTINIRESDLMSALKELEKEQL